MMEERMNKHVIVTLTTSTGVEATAPARPARKLDL